MTATATPTSQAITEWTKIFPKQITENYTSSVTFMKQLTVIAVSTITYLKNAFPEESYFIENFGGLKLRILKQKCRDELAQFLSTALTQAFEAFDKKYLHQLALCFYEDECKAENLIEYHVFEYSYNSEAVTLSVHSKGQDGAAQTRKFTFDSVRERTMHLIRACVVIMQTCQFELPENYDVSLRLYYNEHAPDGYQAPGFSASEEGEEHVRAHAGDAVKLGCVETPYHRLLARTYIRETLRASHEAIPSQNPPMMSQMEPDIDESMTKELSECSETSLLQCPCNKGDSDTDSAGPLLTCQYCKTHQHAACFGLTPENAGQLTEHCCANCSDEDPTRVPTDQRLVSLSRNKRECLCIFRRALWWCARSGAASVRDLSAALGVSDTNATKLMRLLHSHGVVLPPTHPDQITPLKIMTERLNSVMSKFYQVTGEGNLVDRLLAETFASQESQSDPVADVLSPLEKVSLQNASNPVKILENHDDNNKPNRDDSTLRQYKEALLPDNQLNEQLPLSDSRDPITDITNLGITRTTKRKANEDNEEAIPRLRSGVRTKRAKTKE
ncbi:hypothetical protein evm_003062 [Chilo suppressalis]|nr:hypothetical protein evm_003062 [Chilo suppressalis]